MGCGSAAMVEAVVQVGDVSTSYLRCGRGPRVVLVALDPVERLRLLALLAAEHCVVAPAPPRQATSPLQPAGLAAWLRGVLDGLGLQEAEILLGADAAMLAAALGEWGEERVRVLH